MTWNPTSEERADAIRRGLEYKTRELKALADAVIAQARWITAHAQGRTFVFVPKRGEDEDEQIRQD